MDNLDLFLSGEMSWEDVETGTTTTPTFEPPPGPEPPPPAPAPSTRDPFDAFLDGEIPWEDVEPEPEPVYTALGLPVADFGAREEPTAEFTAGRLASQAARGVGQGIADIGRFALAFAERKQLDDPMPFPKYTGWERDPTTPKPGAYRGAMDIAAERTYFNSASPSARDGVPTAIKINSASCSASL